MRDLYPARMRDLARRSLDDGSGGAPTGSGSLSAKVGQENAVDSDVERVVQQIRCPHPLRTVLSAEDLVPHYLYLLTSQSRGSTGHVLCPDGGLSVA